jgi:hypothetical protein
LFRRAAPVVEFEDEPIGPHRVGDDEPDARPEPRPGGTLPWRPPDRLGSGPWPGFFGGRKENGIGG